MKTSVLVIAVVGLALGTPSISLAGQSKASSSSGGSPTTTETSWSQEWQKLENDLNKIFHDTVTRLSPSAKEKELTFSSSVNVRENIDAYVARIYLPERDASKVKVTFENGILHITSADKAAGTYEEKIAIADPVKADKMKVEHKGGIVVVTLPKKLKDIAVAPKIEPALTPWTEDWDQQILRNMKSMNDRMDQLTRDIFAGLPKPSSIKGQPFTGSTVNLQDEKDKYVVHFYLPERDVANVKVEEKDNQLRLTVSEESKKGTTGKSGSNEQYSKEEYSQLITLPGPVHADQMKIDRKEGTVTVTLPKE